MISLPNRPQTIPELLKTTLNLGTATFKQGLPFILISVALYVVGVVITWFTDPTLLTLNPNPASRPANPIHLMYSILSWILLIMVTAGWIYSLHQTIKNQPIPLKDGLQMGVKKAWPYFAVAILFGIIVLIGTVLFIIPGIMAAIYLILSYFIVVVYDKGIVGSLRYSKQLVTGHWWRVAWLYVIIIFIFAALVLAISFGLTFLIASLPISESLGVGILVSLVIFVAYLVTHYAYVFNLALLYDLELRKIQENTHN